MFTPKHNNYTTFTVIYPMFSNELYLKLSKIHNYFIESACICYCNLSKTFTSQWTQHVLKQNNTSFQYREIACLQVLIFSVARACAGAVAEPVVLLLIT